MVRLVEAVLIDESDWPDLWRRRSPYRDTPGGSASDKILLNFELSSAPKNIFVKNSDPGYFFFYLHAKIIHSNTIISI